MALDPRELWIRQAVELGKWFKENCRPCTTCGELTCNHDIHSQMHSENQSRIDDVERRLTALEERVNTALENPPPA